MIDHSVCKHGGLRRKCEICDLQEEVESLRTMLLNERNENDVAIEFLRSRLAEAHALLLEAQCECIYNTELYERIDAVLGTAEQQTAIRRDADLLLSKMRPLPMADDENDRLRAMVAQIRGWLKGGATIRATNPSGPVLEVRDDGTVNGGLTIDFDAALGFSDMTTVREEPAQ